MNTGSEITQRQFSDWQVISFNSNQYLHAPRLDETLLKFNILTSTPNDIKDILQSTCDFYLQYKRTFILVKLSVRLQQFLVTHKYMVIIKVFIVLLTLTNIYFS